MLLEKENTLKFSQVIKSRNVSLKKYAQRVTVIAQFLFAA